MAQKWTDTRPGLTSGYKRAFCQLSDQALVFINALSGGNAGLSYTSDRATVNAIASLSSGTWTLLTSGQSSNMAMCVDSSDNIYVVGVQSTTVWVQAFTKGAGHTWTAQTAVSTTISSGSGTASAFRLMWCNTGGGTNAKGHLLVTFSSTIASKALQAVTVDAGKVLAGTAGPLVNSYVWSTATLTGNPWCDGDQNGLGATTGLTVGVTQTSPSTGAAVIAWSCSSTGVMTTTLSTTSATASSTTVGCGPRVVNYANNAYAIVGDGTVTASHYSVACYSATANTVALTDSGTPTNMPLNGNQACYDIFAYAGRIYVMSPQTSGGAGQVYYAGITVSGSTATWDAAATLADTFSPWFAWASAPTGRCVRSPSGTGTLIDFDIESQPTSLSSTEDCGDYIQFGSAPNAPTLTSPANAVRIDVTAGVTLTGTYNSTDSANQNSYALRIKTGGTYSYWNAGTNALQGTIVWNAITTVPGAAWSVTLPAAAVANGNTYNWSLASQESLANLQGPFAADLTFTAQAAPILAVTGPTGTVTTSTPIVTWTTTPPAGATQIDYQIIVESGAYSTTPGSGTSLWNSGIVGTGGQSATIGAALTNQTTYRAFVQVTETGGQTSVWQFVTFTVTFDSPAVPTVTATPGTDPTTGSPRIVIAVQGHDNLLSAADASVEASSGTWTAGANTTVADSTTQALDGSYSLRLTATASGSVSATTATGVAGAAVQANTTYTILANFRAGATGRSCTVAVNWYTAAGTLISTATSAAATDLTTGWVQALVTGVSPATAAFASVTVTVAGCAAAEQHYADCSGVFPGTVAVWTAGGFAGATTVDLRARTAATSTVIDVQRPVTVGTRIAAALTPGGTQLATFTDWAPASGAVYEYQAVVNALAGAVTAPSAWTA